jgi:hypothetical protein
LRDKKAPTRKEVKNVEAGIVKEVKNVEAGIVNVLFINKIITTESSISIQLIDKKGRQRKAPK